MRLGRARLVASAAAITTLAGAIAAVAIPSADAAAAGPRVALAGSTAVPAPAGAVRLGPLAAGTALKVDVTLKLGNEAGLDALVSGLADRESPYFGRYVGKDEFGPEFGLPLSAIAQVENALRAEGLSVGQADPDRLYIPVTGTAASIGRAFGVTLNRLRLAGGRVAYENSAAPKIPESVAPYVQGVLGLDNVYQPASASQHGPAGAAVKSTGATSTGPASTGGPSVPAAKGPAACAGASSAAVANRGYTAPQLAAHYGMTNLYKAGDLGQGTRVAVAELEPNLPTDIAGYEKCFGIKTKVEDHVVDTGVGSGAGQGEAALDIEDIAGIAPGTTIDVYQDGSTTRDPLYDIAAKVAAVDQDQVLSISYGLCEADAGTATLAAYASVFKALDAKGITTVAASGDTGVTGCYADAKSTKLSPWAPASTAYVLSIGGTAMTSGGPESTEVVWNGSATKFPGAGGGGVSSLLCMPNYQDENQLSAQNEPIAGVISKFSVKAASCKSGSDPKGYRRQVPDVSADGASSSSYTILYMNKWFAFWGTSASTALVAAEAALIDASPFCSAKGWGSGKHVGLLPQSLYDMMTVNSDVIYAQTPRFAVRDITKGNIDDTATGYKGGKYPATKGYDLASGLGAPVLTADAVAPLFAPGMANEMCKWFAVKSVNNISTHTVTPAAGKAGKATKVTVTGTGYLEIPKTDEIEINNASNTKTLAYTWATCSSHGKCKVTLPALKAGTYNVEMLVADFLPCLNGCKPFANFTAKK